MKKNSRIFTAGLLASGMLLAACGKGSTNEFPSNNTSTPETSAVDIVVPSETQASTETKESEITDNTILPDGYVRSQLTNEPILAEDALIRPVALMCPDDSTALPHYNISKADILYECRVEGTISRLMMVIEDWQDLERLGNIRSARDYYVYWAAEWDPILFHYGNPYYADDILASDYIDRVNGTTAVAGIFFRSSDRSAPQNAYISTAGIEYALDYYNISKEHTDKYREGHYTFAENGGQSDLSSLNGAFDCTYLDMSECFPVDDPNFTYNADDGLYYREQYGKAHVDAATGDQLAFSNIIIQNTEWSTRDEKGYLWFNTCDSGRSGYFLTQGKCIPITWSKKDTLSPTKYYDLDGNEIVLSTGKTMVCIVEDGNCSPIFN